MLVRPVDNLKGVLKEKFSTAPATTLQSLFGTFLRTDRTHQMSVHSVKSVSA